MLNSVDMSTGNEARDGLVYLVYYTDSKNFASDVNQTVTPTGTIRQRVDINAPDLYHESTRNGLFFISWYTHWPFYTSKSKHNVRYVEAHYDGDGNLTPDFDTALTVDEFREIYDGCTLDSNYNAVPNQL